MRVMGASVGFPALSQDDWEQHHVIPLSSILQFSMLLFLLCDLFLDLESEENPNSIGHIYLGLPFAGLEPWFGVSDVKFVS
jgi:hypothetical protein